LEEYPVRSCSKPYGEEIHYVGCAKIKNQMNYFVVNDWLVDKETDIKDGLFSKEFLDNMMDNTPYNLTSAQKKN